METILLKRPFQENFPQAVEDYTSALKTFHQCLPLTSREVASSHYKLAIVLESLSDRKQEAIENVEKAIESVQARKAAIERGQDPDHLEDSHDVGGHNLRAQSKVKGRAVANENYKSSDLTMEERKKQVDDCEEQLRDLQAKVRPFLCQLTSYADVSWISLKTSRQPLKARVS